MAERAGLDLAQVEQALASGQAASPQVVRNVRRMVADDHPDPVTFSGRLRRNGCRLRHALAEELGADAPFGEVALDTLDALLASGLGELNESAVIEIARRRPDVRKWPTRSAHVLHELQHRRGGDQHRHTDEHRDQAERPEVGGLGTLV